MYKKKKEEERGVTGFEQSLTNSYLLSIQRDDELG